MAGVCWTAAKVNSSQLPPRWLLPLLLVLLVGSGACALIYQVMWLRLLSLVFGVTAHAASGGGGVHGRLITADIIVSRKDGPGG